MKRSNQTSRVSRVGGIAAHGLAFVVASATFAVGNLPASAQPSEGAAPSPFTGAGPYHAQLVNGGGTSLTVAANGVVTECSGLLATGDKPVLGCAVIGTISVPTVGGIYNNPSFGNSAGFFQGHIFRNWQNGHIWGCSQTTDANGLPNGQCVQFESVPADPGARDESQSLLTHATWGSVNGESFVTMSDILSTGYVFECTGFLSKGTSGAPTGHCVHIGNLTALPSGDTVAATVAGDVDFYYAVNGSTSTPIGQCVRDYNPSTLAPVGACLK